jgi:hypothetical protein
MAKSEVSSEEANAVIDRVAQELGLLVAETSFGRKVQGPTNRHRMYVQRGTMLGRIDFTVPLEADDPAYVQLKSPNGSIRCHVRPDLEQLERCLRMLGDGSLAVQVPTKSKPFAATKAPVGRQPRPTALPVPAMEDPSPEATVDPARARLEDRIAAIKAQARTARIRMVLENTDRYGSLTEAQAEALVDGRTEDGVEPADVVDAMRNSALTETAEVLEEAGIEVVA